MVIYNQKGGRAVCGNGHGISPLSIAGKVLAKIMHNRLMEHILESGFWKSRSTTNMISVLRKLLEKSREQPKGLYKAFIDLSKAYATINREMLWKQKLHDWMQARVLTGELKSWSFKVDVEVKQGCVLAPVLFDVLLSTITHLYHHGLEIRNQKMSSPEVPR